MLKIMNVNPNGYITCLILYIQFLFTGFQIFEDACESNLSSTGFLYRRGCFGLLQKCQPTECCGKQAFPMETIWTECPQMGI
jgi:hypothetical protein